jgi:RNA polymerase sigma factor (sigma-70 family)
MSKIDPAMGPVSCHEADPYGLTPLLEKARAGDRAALDALLAKLRPYLHALVRARLGSEAAGQLDRSALVQEGLVRIFQNIGKLDHPDVPHLLGWVGQIIRHLVVDAVRAGQRDAAKMNGARLWQQLNALTPEDQERQDCRALRVAETLAMLPERRRQVLEMSFLEQLSDAEICQRLGGSVGAVRVMRFRALQELRRLLETCPDSDCRPGPNQADPEGGDR